jgi:uncharacterized membrane protein YdbT with pleckstrin-like domain
MNQLHPKAIWQFFIFFYWQHIILIGTFAFLGTVFLLNFNESVSFGNLALWLVLLSFLLGIPSSYIWARLTYSSYHYELTESGFRKEFGVISKVYVTIPYERIQNVNIYRGLVARSFNLSDLQVQTAGASGSPYEQYPRNAEGALPGLSSEVAEQLRNELIERSRKARAAI